MTHYLESLNSNWLFSKDAIEVPVTMPEGWEKVNLPHTWNAIDGQDGGNDYYRGTCFYVKEIVLNVLGLEKCVGHLITEKKLSFLLTKLFKIIKE